MGSGPSVDGSNNNQVSAAPLHAEGKGAVACSAQKLKVMIHLVTAALALLIVLARAE